MAKAPALAKQLANVFRQDDLRTFLGLALGGACVPGMLLAALDTSVTEAQSSEEGTLKGIVVAIIVSHYNPTTKLSWVIYAKN